MSIYHQIFHPDRKWSVQESMKNFEPFMFLVKPCEPGLSHVCYDTIQEEPTPILQESFKKDNSVDMKELKPTKLKNFFPKKNDSLFWCIYISLNGMKEYDHIGCHYGNTEIEEKQKIMDLMRKEPEKMKTTDRRFTKVLCKEIMSDFMTNQRLTIDMLTTMAVYKNRKIVLINMNEKYEPSKYYMILGVTTSKDVIVIYKRKQFYGLEMNYDEQKIQDIMNKLVCIEDMEKPLKSMTNYKVDELEEMANKINVEITYKMKKQELYEKVLLSLVE